jgi:hypothetical protein
MDERVTQVGVKRKVAFGGRNSSRFREKNKTKGAVISAGAFCVGLKVYV